MKNGILIIVADGQPGGGKDEFLRRLESDPWFMKHALVLGEAAAQITLLHRITQADKALWPPNMWVGFQKLIAEWGIFALNLGIERARRQGKTVLVLNRHIPSGAAYLPGGIDELVTITGITRAAMIDGIDYVICPGPPPQWAYVRHEVGDPLGFRFETYVHACELGAKARRAYVDLGFFPGVKLFDVPGAEDFDEKCEDFLRVIRMLVGQE